MRKMANIGFYPENCNEIENFISYFNEILDKNIDEENKKRLFKVPPKALIVPHAGWVYSGFTANFAYRMTQNFNEKRVIIIGPDHKIGFKGASICLEDIYQTPCKNIPIDTEYSKLLLEKFNLSYIPNAHNEHSTEVQAPFVAHYIKNPSIVEIVYSDYSPKELSKIIDFLLQDENNLIVISTDLSHYYDKQTAMALDYNCIQAVYDLDISKLQNCEACGKIGVEAMILSADKNNLSSLVVDYRTSADASNDESQVVGYMSAIFI